MSFVRTVKQENPFVQIDKGFVGNGKLSLKATGLLTYFLSKPDGWKIRLADVKNRFTDGETAVRSGLKELIKEGYIFRYRERIENGHWGDYVYLVYERPEFNPYFIPKLENHVQEEKPLSPKRDFPRQDNPEQENHVHSNNDFSNNDFSNNELKKEEEEEGNYRLNELVSFFSKNITATATEVIKNKIDSWMKVLPFEVIKAELENCALHGAKSWKYVEKALLENQELNITTIEQLEQKHAKHQTKRKETKTPSKGQSKPRRREKLPEWFDKEEEVSKPGGAQNEDIAAKKKALEAKLAKYKVDMEQSTIN